MLNNEITTKKDWKHYVDSRPVYIILGIALAHLVWQTGIVQKITEKITKKAD